MRQEKEYKQICKEIDEEAKLYGAMDCFFCGKEVKSADHHHLDGRDGDLLTKKEWIVRAHRRCHRAYHDDPIEDLSWFEQFLSRLKQKDFTLWQREMYKYDK